MSVARAHGDEVRPGFDEPENGGAVRTGRTHEEPVDIDRSARRRRPSGNDLDRAAPGDDCIEPETGRRPRDNPFGLASKIRLVPHQSLVCSVLDRSAVDLARRARRLLEKQVGPFTDRERAPGRKRIESGGELFRDDASAVAAGVVEHDPGPAGPLGKSAVPYADRAPRWSG